MLYILPTIDTENLQTPFRARKYDRSVLDVHFDGEPWGTTRLADIFRAAGIEATFFLAVNEADHLGDEPLAALAQMLVDKHQDVQIHAHPIWSDAGGSPREHMHQYGPAEQRALLESMKERLMRWTGRVPIAHRAGGYGINEDTIHALREVGIRVDSSMFYGHPNCKVAWSKNAVVEREGIVEIPITGLYKYRPMRAGLFGIAHERFFAKTDLDSCSLNELLLYVEAAKERNVSVMNLFMHSYSLLAFDGKFRCFKPDRSDDEKLRGFLATAANTGNVRFMSVAGFWEQYQRDPSGFHGSDSVPESPERTGTVRFFFGKAKDRVARLIDRIA